MFQIPLAAVPSQNFSAALNGQAVQVAIYVLGVQAAAAMYMDLASNGVPVFSGRIIRAFSGLPQNAPPFMTVGAHYLGFEGDFLFVDTQASANNPAQDPTPEGLGTRWQLLYLTPQDLEGAGLIPTPSAPVLVESEGLTTLGGIAITTLGGTHLVTVGS